MKILETRSNIAVERMVKKPWGGIEQDGVMVVHEDVRKNAWYVSFEPKNQEAAAAMFDKVIIIWLYMGCG